MSANHDPACQPARNWFDQGGQNYARFRPSYPAEIAASLAALAPDNQMAVDVGCGNGQLTRLLAPYFQQVIGLDPSVEQINNALPEKGVLYQCAPAEQLPLAEQSVSLLTAAQAAHWFDLPLFWKEVHRVARPGAIVALLSYGILTLEPALHPRFQHFYDTELGPYWPPERALVESGYATIAFPFAELTPPALSIRVEWQLAEFLGYIFTWSAVRRAREAGKEEIPVRFAKEMTQAWGDGNTRHTLVWPINMRLGRV
ncbi:class I SAM-dependent methyltransferase [Candidatus Magnetaquicoccus inordinatus]|uniref:class I SAM-dependent methyltransferase n=1 Tax=Candidatus Magnetaquicoccus inordinatus TaxID=2496818 RepID=UPI00102CE7E1|nr:class I SAM-dependent methyltransferase [Candidatus Magnetaquicoccus inordinatus]